MMTYLTQRGEFYLKCLQVVTMLIILSSWKWLSNQMQQYTVYLYLQTALHVSVGISTHHQELITLYLQYLLQCVPLTTEPGISLMILTPMKILQRDLNRSTFVVWEMKVAVTVFLIPDTVDTVLWVSYEGWRYRPKHVQQSTVINKLLFCCILLDNYWQILQKHGGLNIKLIFLVSISKPLVV